MGLRFIVLILVGLSFVSAAFAETKLHLAEALYRDGKFQESRRILLGLIKAEPNNADAHYMLGSVLVKVNDLAGAAREFRAVLKMGGGGQAAEYSQKALDAIIEGQRRPAPPVPAPKAVAESESVTTRVGDEIERLAAERDARMAEIKRESDDRVKQLKSEMRERIEANGRARYGRGRMYYDPAPLNQEVANEIRPRIEQVQNETRRKTDELNKYYDLRMEGIRGRSKLGF